MARERRGRRDLIRGVKTKEGKREKNKKKKEKEKKETGYHISFPNWPNSNFEMLKITEWSL